MKRNKINQSKYKVVSNPLYGYRFNLPECYAAAIVALTVGAAIAIGFNLGILLSGSWKELPVGLLYTLILAGPFLFMGIWQTLWTRKVKKIITNGEQVDGKIVAYRRYADYNSSVRANATLLYVIFDYHGKQYCTVPAGKKRPEKKLASPYCKVFIFDEKIFVKDFELRKKGDPEIEFLERHIKHMSSDYL